MTDTKIINRKTPHAKIHTIEGKGTNKKLVWDFEFGNVNDRLVKKLIPITRCYVKSGNQDVPDYVVTSADMRNCSTRVWNAMSKNWKKFRKFKTNYQIKQEQEENLAATRTAERMWEMEFPPQPKQPKKKQKRDEDVTSLIEFLV